MLTEKAAVELWKTVHGSLDLEGCNYAATDRRIMNANRLNQQIPMITSESEILVTLIYN